MSNCKNCGDIILYGVCKSMNVDLTDIYLCLKCRYDGYSIVTDGNQIVVDRIKDSKDSEEKEHRERYKSEDK